MDAVTVTPEVAFVLKALKESTEVRDVDGQPLGVFTPAAVMEQERIGALFDVEEAERILATQGDQGKPLQEFWRELRGQGASE